MPPSAETCRPWPNRGRACQRAPPSEADEEDAAGPLKDRLIAELTEHRTKVITSIGGSIARKSALASASRIQKQKRHSLSLVTTSVFPAKTASPRFGIRPAGHGGGPGLPRSPGRHPPDPAAGPTFSARDVRTFHYSRNRHGLRDQFLEGADNSEAARIRWYMARVSVRRRLRQRVSTNCPSISM